MQLCHTDASVNVDQVGSGNERLNCGGNFLPHNLNFPSSYEAMNLFRMLANHPSTWLLCVNLCHQETVISFTHSHIV